MILYNRKKVKYRKDGYCWKKRKDGKTTREDHMKLKVQGVEVKGWEACATPALPGPEGTGLVWSVQAPCCHSDPRGSPPWAAAEMSPVLFSWFGGLTGVIALEGGARNRGMPVAC